MKKTQISKTLLVVLALFLGAISYAQDEAAQVTTIEETDETTTSAMQSDIISIVASSADHSTLARALQAADLVSTLSGKGPFTVFAPTNKAFDALPSGKLASLLMPDNKAKLGAILSNHVIAGEVTAEDLKQAIEAGSGKAELKTVAGDVLVASMQDANVILTDSNGNKSRINSADNIASNGVVHGIDALVMPINKKGYNN